MLELDHTKRISAKDALNHPFFNDLADNQPAGAPNGENMQMNFAGHFH